MFTKGSEHHAGDRDANSDSPLSPEMDVFALESNRAGIPEAERLPAEGPSSIAQAESIAHYKEVILDALRLDHGSGVGRRYCSVSALDLPIVHGLGFLFRVATARQIARLPTDSLASLGAIEERLRRLVQNKLLCSFTLRAHPELPLDAPLCRWKPGDPVPPFGVISYRLRSRWTEPLKPIRVYTASPRAVRLYAGGCGPLSRPLQVTHDLHVTAIYIRLRRENPAEATHWVSENVLAPLRRGKKIPDAEIHGSDGRVLKVIEFGGGYAPERVRKVHEDCERRQVPYELW